MNITRATMRWERLASAIRMLERAHMELLEELRVVNRKVETIYDQQQTDLFLKEEDSPNERDFEEVPPRSVA